MLRFSAVGASLLLGSFLYAQQPATRTETTTTKTTWSGQLVDEGCYTSHSQTKESKSSEKGATKTQTTTTVTTECPVTPTTTTFGFVTADGKFMRFDAPSNSRIVQIVKSKKDLEKSKIQVVGTANGDVIVLEEIQ